MMTRDELVEAVSREVFARTYRGKPNDGWSGPDDWRTIEKITGYYIDAIEPRVREDMSWHQKVNAESAVALMQWRDELQAKIEALDAEEGSDEGVLWVVLDEVLALIKGTRDGPQ